MEGSLSFHSFSLCGVKYVRLIKEHLLDGILNETCGCSMPLLSIHSMCGGHS